MAQATDTSETRVLGRVADEATDTLDLINVEDLETKPRVKLTVHEFTSHCPVTKQPDYASLTFIYVPGKHLVETKSFKLWLQRYRHKAEFNERLVAKLCAEFVEQVKPRHLRVTGTFARRGGIHVEATQNYYDETALIPTYAGGMDPGEVSDD